MKLTSLTIAVLAGLNVAPASASFFIYWSQDTVSGTGAYLYYFFRGHPSCNDVINARAYTESNDVSKIQGVVCDGPGCYNGKFEEVKRMEMNTNFGHYSESLQTRRLGLMLDMGLTNITQPSTRIADSGCMTLGIATWERAVLLGRILSLVARPSA
jgi:hypothetical protein